MNVTTHSMGFVISIKLHDVIPLPGFGIFPLMAISWTGMEFFIYPLLGKIYERSGEFKERWRERLENAGTEMEKAEGKRQSRALQCLGIQISSVYTVKKTTVLIVVGAVINLTVNFLLVM